MDQGVISQLITAVATLSGVVLTLFANAFLERRRARDGQWLEVLKTKSQHAVWLREERQEAYALLSLAGENVLQFVRTDVASADLLGSQEVQRVESRWHELRADLRKAYNQVELFGSDDVRDRGARMWRAARDGLDDLFASVRQQDPPSTTTVAEAVRAVAAELGRAGRPYMEACRRDLQDVHSADE